MAFIKVEICLPVKDILFMLKRPIVEGFEILLNTNRDRFMDAVAYGIKNYHQEDKDRILAKIEETEPKELLKKLDIDDSEVEFDGERDGNFYYTVGIDFDTSWAERG